MKIIRTLTFLFFLTATLLFAFFFGNSHSQETDLTDLTDEELTKILNEGLTKILNEQATSISINGQIISIRFNEDEYQMYSEMAKHVIQKHLLTIPNVQIVPETEKDPNWGIVIGTVLHKSGVLAVSTTITRPYKIVELPDHKVLESFEIFQSNSLHLIDFRPDDFDGLIEKFDDEKLDGMIAKMADEWNNYGSNVANFMKMYVSRGVPIGMIDDNMYFIIDEKNK